MIRPTRFPQLTAALWPKPFLSRELLYHQTSISSRLDHLPYFFTSRHISWWDGIESSLLDGSTISLFTWMRQIDQVRQWRKDWWLQRRRKCKLSINPSRISFPDRTPSPEAVEASMRLQGRFLRWKCSRNWDALSQMASQRERKWKRQSWGRWTPEASTLVGWRWTLPCIALSGAWCWSECCLSGRYVYLVVCLQSMADTCQSFLIQCCSPTQSSPCAFPCSF